jgi:hypothetical protein
MELSIPSKEFKFKTPDGIFCKILSEDFGGASGS